MSCFHVLHKALHLELSSCRQRNVSTGSKGVMRLQSCLRYRDTLNSLLKRTFDPTGVCFRETWLRVVSKAIPSITTLIFKLVLVRQDIFPVFHIAVLGKAGFPPFFPQELQKTSVHSKNTAASVDHVSH